MMTPMSVSVLGWMRSLTQRSMIARSGSMHAAPTRPVNVRRFRKRSGSGACRIMEGSGTGTRRDIVPYGHPRTQGADCPAAGAARSLSVLQRGRRHDLRREGARAARSRPQLPGRPRRRRQDRRAPGRSRPPRVHRHRFGRGGAGAREQSHQAALAEVQHPAARRQELSVPAADDQRAVSARPRRAPRRARRELLRRPVHAGALRAPHDGADAPAVRDSLVQRSDHGQARAALPRVRHQALHRAVRRRGLLARRVRARGRDDAALSRGEERRADRNAAGAHGRGGRARAVRAGGAAARRDADGADAPGSPAEDGDRGDGAPRRLRVEARAGGRGDPGLSGAQRARGGARGARDRRGDRRIARGRGARGRHSAVLRAARRAAGDPCAGRARRARGARVVSRQPRRAARTHRRAAARRQAQHGRSGEPQRRHRVSDALQPGEDRAVRRARDAAARARAAVAAAADRMLRHLDDSGERDRRVDGRLRGRADATVGLPEVPHSRRRRRSWRLEARGEP